MKIRNFHILTIRWVRSLPTMRTVLWLTTARWWSTAMTTSCCTCSPSKAWYLAAKVLPERATPTIISNWLLGLYPCDAECKVYIPCSAALALCFVFLHIPKALSGCSACNWTAPQSHWFHPSPFLSDLFKNRPPFPYSYILNMSEQPVFRFSPDVMRVFLHRIASLEQFLRDKAHYFRTDMVRCGFLLLCFEIANGSLRYTEEPDAGGEKRFFIRFVQILQHVREEHSVNYYASQLCITPNTWTGLSGKFRTGPLWIGSIRCWPERSPKCSKRRMIPCRRSPTGSVSPIRRPWPNSSNGRKASRRRNTANNVRRDVPEDSESHAIRKNRCLPM